MTASSRFVVLNNSSGVALTAQKAQELQTDEKDYANYTVERVFTAADIGAAKGQTKDATDPAQGCLLMAPITGAKLKFVKSVVLMRPTVIQNTTFLRIVEAGAPAATPYNIDISDDGHSATLLDTGAGTSAVAAGDHLVITFASTNN